MADYPKPWEPLPIDDDHVPYDDLDEAPYEEEIIFGTVNVPPAPSPRKTISQLPKPRPAPAPKAVVTPPPAPKPKPRPAPRPTRHAPKPEVERKIKAIQTEYNGFLFRSRTEARWAVFFDAIGINYRYELEGYDLSESGYLPDFYLPDYKVWVEIKPLDADIVRFVGDYNEWEKKCDRFRSESGQAIVICYDAPSYDNPMRLFAWDTCDSGGGESEFDAVFKHEKGKTYLVGIDAREDRSLHVTERFDTSDLVITAWEWLHLDSYRTYRALKKAALDEVEERFDPKANDVLNLAKKASRQVRFEHGETPTKQEVQRRIAAETR